MKNNLINRITISKSDEPTIRDTKVKVSYVMALLRSGDKWDVIITTYPKLEVQDIAACIMYDQKIDV